MQGVTWGWLCGSHEVSVRVVSALAAAAHKVAVVNDAIASVRTLSMDAISQSVRAEPERGNWNRRACSNSMTPYGGIFGSAAEFLFCHTIILSLDMLIVNMPHTVLLEDRKSGV